MAVQPWRSIRLRMSRRCSASNRPLSMSASVVNGTFVEQRGRSSMAELAQRGPAAEIRPMSSLRLPQTFARRLGVETGDAVLRYELVEEQAFALGRMGRKAEAALAALRSHEGEGRAEV